jgi:hypothetical protein
MHSYVNEHKKRTNVDLSVSVQARFWRHANMHNYFQHNKVYKVHEDVCFSILRSTNNTEMFTLILSCSTAAVLNVGYAYPLKVRRESSKVARSSNKVAKLADYPVKYL